ncbi:MAG: haloalkane dehalogenase [Candidatus Hydrogenedentes bacterium]|nr:haloalkane dehalogenase [Candidatus Hydrogenedentota bacterium]
MSETISAADPYTRQRVKVLDSEMAYVDTGGDAPIVFLHGNPTSSYLWRNIIREAEGSGRCLAPDLIGMGESGKAAGGDYTFASHAKYLDAWFDAVLPSGKLVLVVHDWGSGLGFHWANRHRDRVEGIVYMEAIVQPMAWDDWPEGARKIFEGMRSDAGEEMVLEKNVFVERILPASVLRGLSDEEMEVYRRPYVEPGESRRPTLTWPRQIPLEGAPEDVTKIVQEYGAWLSSEESLPKLFINADPGTILIGKQRDFCRTWPMQEEITVKGLHFIQEDAPVEIGRAVAAFVDRVRREEG